MSIISKYGEIDYISYDDAVNQNEIYMRTIQTLAKKENNCQSPISHLSDEMLRHLFSPKQIEIFQVRKKYRLMGIN